MIGPLIGFYWAIIKLLKAERWRHVPLFPFFLGLLFSIVLLFSPISFFDEATKSSNLNLLEYRNISNGTPHSVLHF